jgi:hypothetical protein
MVSPNDDCKWVWLGGGGANFLVALLRLNAQTKKYGEDIRSAVERAGSGVEEV